jgi:hypothetical protein
MKVLRDWVIPFHLLAMRRKRLSAPKDASVLSQPIQTQIGVIGKMLLDER